MNADAVYRCIESVIVYVSSIFHSFMRDFPSVLSPVALLFGAIKIPD